MVHRSRAVLITGCSSGIGQASARRLAGRGWTVYATARRLSDVETLQAAGCRPLQLDVTDEESMRAAVETIVEREGAVEALVNNAGYSQGGPIEQVSPAAVRTQFETNVFGAIRLAQLVLPGMRAQRWGRIVNVGSMGGRLTFPGGGLYHATKHALEAISDALRFEVRGFGVDVVLIEPGLIRTPFAERAVATIAEARGTGAPGAQGADGEDPYGPLDDALARLTAAVYNGPTRLLGGSPETVAKAVERAITTRRPPTRMLLTPSARLMVLQRRLLPDRAWDAMMRTQLPEPR